MKNKLGEDVNLKYVVFPVLFAIVLIVTGIFGVLNFILFMRGNFIAYQITSFALATLGAYFLYKRLSRAMINGIQINSKI